MNLKQTATVLLLCHTSPRREVVAS